MYKMYIKLRTSQSMPLTYTENFIGLPQSFPVDGRVRCIAPGDTRKKKCPLSLPKVFFS